MTAGSAQQEANYVLSIEGRERHEDDRLSLLQEIFDPTTRQRLDFVRPGWKCLEVGAGRGSIAAWLADRVGAAGQVVAADLDTTLLGWLSLPNLRVVQHNIVTGPVEALGPPGTFDLVHARFLMQHLRDGQDTAIARMKDCLKPGGWIVLEDTDTLSMAAADMTHPLAEAFNRQMEAAAVSIRSTNTIDATAGRGLYARLERAGFADVRHEAIARLVPGGSPLARWFVQSTEATRAFYLSRGTDYTDGIDLAIRAFSDPSFRLLSTLEHCVWGRKP
jgi:ubiquinone/menaquinone biosynthesis C-methylase UbiE